MTHSIKGALLALIIVMTGGVLASEPVTNPSDQADALLQTIIERDGGPGGFGSSNEEPAGHLARRGRIGGHGV